MAARPARRRPRARRCRRAAPRAPAPRGAVRGRAPPPALPHLRGDELDDIALQAADDALVSVLRRLDDFRGESRFTTWAYKFALLEAAVKLRKRAWQGARCRSSPRAGTLFGERATSSRTRGEQGELLARCRTRSTRCSRPTSGRCSSRWRSTASRSTSSPSGSARPAAPSTRRCTTRGASFGRYLAEQWFVLDHSRRGTDERPDLKQALGRLLGPAGPEVGCDECFEQLDRYVELEWPGRRRHRDPRAACAPRRLPGVPRGAREPARARGRRAAVASRPPVGSRGMIARCAPLVTGWRW